MTNGKKVVLGMLALMGALLGGLYWMAKKTQDPSNLVVPPPIVVILDVPSEVAIQDAKVKPGRYEVRLDRASEAVTLVGDAGTYYLRVKRFVRPDVKDVGAELKALDGGRYALLVRVPPSEEWAA